MPAALLILEGDATLECDDTPDPVHHEAGEVPVADLPASCLVSLLGSRYCDTDRCRHAD